MGFMAAMEPSGSDKGTITYSRFPSRFSGIRGTVAKCGSHYNAIVDKLPELTSAHRTERQ